MTSYEPESGSLFAERVPRAHRMTPEQKFAAGPDLFEYACEITRQGIRCQFPAAGPEQVERILADRLAMQRRLESQRVEH